MKCHCFPGSNGQKMKMSIILFAILIFETNARGLHHQSTEFIENLPYKCHFLDKVINDNTPELTYKYKKFDNLESLKEFCTFTPLTWDIKVSFRFQCLEKSTASKWHSKHVLSEVNPQYKGYVNQKRLPSHSEDAYHVIYGEITDGTDKGKNDCVGLMLTKVKDGCTYISE
jgi:hypothetical protein